MKKIMLFVFFLLLCTPTVLAGSEPTVEISYHGEIFKLFALANASGYNNENLGYFSEARRNARDYMQNHVEKCGNIVTKFRKETSDDPYYSRAIFDILKSSAGNPISKRQRSLALLLNRYYTCAGLDELEKILADEYSAEINFYKLHYVDIIIPTLNILNIPASNYATAIHIIPNPLDAHYRGYNVQNQDVIYIVVGAGLDRNNLQTVIHELIHKAVDQVIFSPEYDFSPIQPKFDYIRSMNEEIGKGYSDIRLYMSENIVIALEVLVSSKIFNASVDKLLGNYRKKVYIYSFPFLEYVKNHKKNNSIRNLIGDFIKFAAKNHALEDFGVIKRNY